jgi:cytoskeletal protein CcmA (bactofilin family)
MARAATQDTAGGADAAVLGRTTRVRGRVHGTGDLRVEGQLEGDVRVTGDLAIEDGGSVNGDVDANAVSIQGELVGDVAARGAVAIRAGARVFGNMGGSEVTLEEGAVFAGRIEAEFELPPELTARGRER